MHHHKTTSAPALRRLVNGYQISQALHVAATLGIADLLADGPRNTQELAEATGSHEPSLYRLLRALAGASVFREGEDRRFALTPLGEGLCSDAAEPVGGWAAFIGQPYMWQAWAHLLHSVRTGETGFRHVHGMTNWEYRQQHPELSTVFDRAMTALTQLVSASVLSAYDFSRFARPVDIGGGHGAFLAALLARYPAMYGVLFDQPLVVAGAEHVLKAAGVAGRCRVVGGDFFAAVPAGGDAYLLKAVLHDWPDEPAVAILHRCRQAMSADATLLVIERELAPANEGADGKFSDLNMLVATGGEERTHEQYAALFAAAGFRFVGATPGALGVSVVEGIPV